MPKGFYIVAVFAMKVDPEASARVKSAGGSAAEVTVAREADARHAVTPLRADMRVEPITAYADSEPEAREAGLEFARRVWPEADGWIGHFAAAKPLTRDQLLQTLQETAPDDTDTDELDPVM